LHIALLLAVVAALTASPAAAQAPTDADPRPVVQQARAVADLFRAEPTQGLEDGYASLFTQGFLNQVPAAQLTGLFTRYHAQYGSVTDVEPRSIENPTTGRFDLLFEKGFRVPIRSIQVEATPPHRIAGLRLGAAERVEQIPSLSALADSVAALPGTSSFLLAELGGAGALDPLASHRPDSAQAIGSAFKLYVLGALVQAVEAGDRAWSDVVRLRDADRSLPSGFLQEWPTDAPLTLHSLAALMISRSDNTATDLLMRVLGRQTVEATQAAMGHAASARNKPFLTTRELFALKSDSALAARYVDAPTPEQRALLREEVAALDRGTFAPPASPTRIGTLEWFASARDLARALAWFRADGAARATARAILAINPGLDLGDRWTYVGFKGGSEPGVVSTNFLLHDGANDRWYTLTLAQNDPEADVDQSRFFALVKQAARLVE
jgi:hypothetical protein